MEEKMREQIALFRYGLIAPLMNDSENRKQYLMSITSKSHHIPYYGERKIAEKTIQEWFLQYRRKGLEGLKPRNRSDRGRSRRLDPEQLDHILALRKECLLMPVTVFYDQLIEKGEIKPDEISYSTVNRLLKKHKLVGKEIATEPGRKRFAYDTVNTLWQGDMSHGPSIVIDGKKRKTFLFAFIDDCSRVIPFAQFFLSEKFDGVRTVLKQAFLRRGIPKMIYADNGKIYRSSTLQLACAHLGIILTHTQPYDPQSKGKIERMFRTVQTRFYPLLQADPVSSLKELNDRFWEWLERDYHRKPHASLEGHTPHEVYFAQTEHIRLVDDPDALDPIFLKRETRKVKHDSTISINKQLYEVPPRYIGQNVEIRFDEERTFIYEDGQEIQEIHPISFSDNAHVKRERQRLSFSEMDKMEEADSDV